jgi:hypothetical protein
MPNPQQPELRRNKLNPADQDSAKLHAGEKPRAGHPHGTDKGRKGGGRGGGVPPEQRPPHPRS